MDFRQVTIVGVGLLGGSLGLAMRRRKLAETIVGVGHRESTLERAVRRGAVDRWTLDPAEGVRGADLVVLATPVGLFAPLAERAADAFDAGCIVTDVGSTKRDALAELNRVLPERCRLVGSHPLAGSEARGIDAASEQLYDGALVLTVPTARSDDENLDRVDAFWRAVGARVRRIDADTHDRILARTSHLPHLLAAAMVATIGPDADDLVGKGLLDTTRIASGDPGMWRDIFETNRDEVTAALGEFEAVLARVRTALADGDAAAIERFLADAKTRRDGLVERFHGNG